MSRADDVQIKIRIPRSLDDELRKILENPRNPAKHGFKNRALVLIIKENLPRLRKLLETTELADE